MEMNPEILMARSKPEGCSECGCPTFTIVHAFRRISKIYIPGAQDDALMPIPIYKCEDCKTPMDMDVFAMATAPQTATLPTKEETVPNLTRETSNDRAPRRSDNVIKLS